MLGEGNDLHGNLHRKKWKLYQFLIIIAFSQIIKAHCENYLWLADNRGKILTYDYKS